MLNKIKPKSDFARNVLTLMTGTTISQAIPIAISPILTRLYSPEDFGIFALFMGLVSILAIISTGRYELAIMLPKKDEDAKHIAALAVGISLIISMFLFIIVSLFNHEITNLLGNKEISVWLYWIPFTVFVTSLYQSLNFLNIRNKQYKNVASSKVTQSTTLSLSSLTIGYSPLNNIGLISGQILGQISAASYLLYKNIKKGDINFKNLKRLKAFALAKRYQEFPKIVTWTGALNTSSVHAPVLILTSIFSLKVVGFYSFAQRIITLPNALIAGAIGQVFYQEVSKKKSIEDKAKLFQATFFKLLKISAPIFALIFVFGDKIFEFVFGTEWIVAGEYAQVMSIWLFLVFLISPLSQLFNILEKQRLFLKLNILSFSLRIISLFVGGLLFDDILITLYLFIASGVIAWVIILIVMLSLLKINKINILIKIFVYFSAYLIFFYLLNNLL